MTTIPPEKSAPAPVPAPIGSRLTALIAVTGIAVLAVSLTMAYRESSRHTSAASSLVSPNAGNQSALFTLNIHQQPRTLPDFRFTDENGRAMTLQDFRGRIVLVNVWATWCPPCRKEMPTLDRLQEKLGGANFEVVALSIDHGGARIIKSFYDAENIRKLRIYVDNSGDAMTSLGIAAIPATLLIDREGREIGRKIGPAEWDSPEIISLIQAYLAPPASNLPVKP